MAYTQEQRYWIWLASIYGLGTAKFCSLLEKSGPPQQVWEEFGPWMEPLIGAHAYQALRQARSAAYFDALFSSMEKAEVVAVTATDPEYPPLLLETPGAPQVLFVRGRVALNDAQAIGIVGARNCTAYGTRMARKLARDVSRMGVTVVSGLARGIDSAAHRGAVDVKARTVAVLGSGVDVVYPPEHRTLAEEILEAGGSLISELRPGSPPRPQHFPARNRIISGMSKGLLLVEGANRSGAMSTVNFALEQGRTVMALPGQADSPLSAAPHRLIREGASLVMSAEDIIADLGWEKIVIKAGMRTGHATAVLPFTQKEQAVYNLLGGGPVDTETLVEITGLPPPELNALLTVMELHGTVRKLPGRRVERMEAE